MSFLDSLLQWLGLSRSPGGQTPPVQPALPPDNTTEPARILTCHALLVVYDPVVDAAGTKLSAKMHWNRPDDLANIWKQNDYWTVHPQRFPRGLAPVVEAAKSLGISLRTAERSWSYARTWLHREVSRGGPTDHP